MARSLKDAIRVAFTTRGESATHDEIRTGALQRIADATELMARNHAKLLEERDRYARWWNEARIREDKLERRVAALRGVITRMKRKAAS